MVTIKLPSPIVSVAVALTNVLVELVVLKAFKNLNTMYECAMLERHRLIPIRSHMRRIRVVSVLSLFLFLVLEVIYSTFSFPFISKNMLTEACISVRPSVETRFKEHQFSLEALTTVASCLTVDGDEVSVRIGNFSLESKNTRVRCSEKVYFKFRIKDRRMLSTADSALSCVSTEIEDYCVRAKHGDNDDDDELWLTDAHTPISIMNEELPFRRSEVYFPFQGHLKFFATRMAQNAVNGGGNNPFFRNSVLLDEVRDTCVFEEDGARATNTPTPIFVILVASWGISLTAFILTSVQHRKRFYNLGNAFDFASKTKRASDGEHYPIENASIRMTVDSNSVTQFVMCSAVDQQRSSEEEEEEWMEIGDKSAKRVLRDEKVAHLKHEAGENEIESE